MSRSISIPIAHPIVAFLLAALACCTLVAQEKPALPAEGGKSGDWNQWGGSPSRNNTPSGRGIPIAWDAAAGTNIKWVAKLGDFTCGTPVVAGGKVYIGTNNGAGRVKRYPAEVDLGVLVCFDERDGRFLWQHSSEKLSRDLDRGRQGICGSPLVEGNRLWFITNRCEVCCLDTEGYHDNEDDGPSKLEAQVALAKDEADCVWSLDLRAKFGVVPHEACSFSVTSAGDRLFLNTGNGLGADHLAVANPLAPSFVCLDKNTGEVLWTDASPGHNILHCQWSSPAYGEFDGSPQVIFAGGDGWLYSFDPKGEGGKAKLLWKFDCNPKKAGNRLGALQSSRSHFIGTPVVYGKRIYIAVGEDPEHGEGVGRLWCIDPAKRGDVSPTQVFNRADPANPIPHKRLLACEPDKGDFERDNPNSAVVWEYAGVDRNGNGNLEFEEVMHRTCGTVAIKDDLLYIADLSGLFHCVDAKTGRPHWTHDLLSAAYGSALVVDGHVYQSTEDGDVVIFKHSADPKAARPIALVSAVNSIFTTPIVANNVLYVASRTHLFAIQQGAQLKGPRGSSEHE